MSTVSGCLGWPAQTHAHPDHPIAGTVAAKSGKDPPQGVRLHKPPAPLRARSTSKGRRRLASMSGEWSRRSAQLRNGMCPIGLMRMCRQSTCPAVPAGSDATGAAIGRKAAHHLLDEGWCGPAHGAARNSVTLFGALQPILHH